MQTESKRATNAYELREQRFKDWYRWLPVKGAGAICPRRIAGKHCLRFTFRFSKHCICNRSYRSDLFDHCALWRDENGDFVFTSEPYHSRGSRLAQLSSDISELGLEAEVLPRSGWNPNSTILIVVRRRRQQVLDDKLDHDVLRERVSGIEDVEIDLAHHPAAESTAWWVWRGQPQRNVAHTAGKK
jgi:hypothetical protein